MKLEVVITIDKEWNTLASRIITFDNLSIADVTELAELADGVGEAVKPLIKQLARQIQSPEVAEDANNEE